MNFKQEVVLAQRTIFIGIIRTSSIGDVVIATTAIDFVNILKPTLPDTHFKLLFISRNPCVDLLKQAHPDLQVLDMDLHTSDSDLLNQLNELDLLIDLQGNPRSRQWCRKFKRATGKPIVYANKHRLSRLRLVWEAFFRRRSEPLPNSTMQSNVPQYQMVIDALREGIEKLSLPIDLISHKLEFNRARPILPMEKSTDRPMKLDSSQIGWIAIAPGASYSAKKCPDSMFLKILNEFQQATPSSKLPKIVFLGDKNDSQSVKSIISDLKWPTSILNLSGQTTLTESAIVLSQCKLILCNDSSLGHMGEAIGIPAGVLYGPTVEAFGFKPFRQNSRSFSVPLGCRPCSRHGSKPCKFKDSLCFTSIKTSDVVHWLQNSLGNGNFTPEISILESHQRGSNL
jgi:ADP-heptose:LPS heptosyltransferase